MVGISKVTDFTYPLPRFAGWGISVGPAGLKKAALAISGAGGARRVEGGDYAWAWWSKNERIGLRLDGIQKGLFARLAGVFERITWGNWLALNRVVLENVN